MKKKSNGGEKTRKFLIGLFEKHEYEDYKWIDPQKIVVSHWARM